VRFETTGSTGISGSTGVSGSSKLNNVPE